jgi:hypothetical protein
MTGWNETELPEASKRKTRLFGMSGKVDALPTTPTRVADSDRRYTQPFSNQPLTVQPPKKEGNALSSTTS